MIDVNLLKNKIEKAYGENGLTRFYNDMGNAPFTVRRKIKGEIDFNNTEMIKVAKLLGLSNRDIIKIFFAK